MRFVCESCRAQYMINDDKVGPKGVKVRCRKCDYVITVKRPAAAPKVGPEPDEMATQVMTPPAAGSRPVEGEEADSVGRPKENFLGADDDEIGAVFDQVLRSGPTSAPKPGPDGLPGSALSTDFDEHESTRVIDAATVAQLARESSSTEPAAEKVEAVPESNWFVAINEKQTGPLSLDQVKEHWDKGEVGPDSLCWREGFQDWLPLSEVKSLAVVLAPKPPRPIVVPAATIPASAAAVGSSPVQSAFSAGGVGPGAQGEPQAPMPPVAASTPEDSGAWKPSAASALASLVKDEMEALARPSAPSPAPAAQPAVGGLLDVPDDKGALSGPLAGSVAASAAAAAAGAARPPVNPYAANPAATYSTPGMTSYRPPSTNRGMVIGVGVGVGVVLVGLIASVVWLAVGRTGPTSGSPGVTTPAQASVQGQAPQAQAQAQAAAAPAPAPAPSMVPSAAPGTTPSAPTPTSAKAPDAAAPALPGPSGSSPATPATAARSEATAPRESMAAAKSTTSRKESKEGRGRAEAPAAEVKEPPAEEAKAARSSGGDEFDDAFGKPTSRREEPKKPAPTKRDTYVPPAPGAGADLKETLGQSDIMEVVLSNKPALLKCAEEQHQKEPGTNGKLVIRWSIQGNGRVSNVVVVSEEFKNTYMAGCVGKAIKGWVFPRSKNPPEPFTLPVKF